jgi:two-component system OmpR family response regulator/two-component system response regulator QseB
MPTQSGKRHDGARILIVDDEPEIAIAMGDYLVNFGYSVTTAGELEEAKALLSVSRFDVVIADVLLTPLGGNEGLEIIGFIRERCPAMKVVAFTSVTSDIVAAEIRRLGADVLLYKPVTLGEMEATVSRLMEVQQ